MAAQVPEFFFRQSLPFSSKSLYLHQITFILLVLLTMSALALLKPDASFDLVAQYCGSTGTTSAIEVQQNGHTDEREGYWDGLGHASCHKRADRRAHVDQRSSAAFGMIKRRAHRRMHHRESALFRYHQVDSTKSSDKRTRWPKRGMWVA